MAAISAQLTATLPSLPTPRPCPRRLTPSAFAASVATHRTPGAALRGCRHGNPLPARIQGFQNAISFGKERKKQMKQAIFASGRGSPGSSDDSSTSPDGPPVLTILAGVIVFLLVLWVIGSIIIWIVGLTIGAAKS